MITNYICHNAPVLSAMLMVFVAVLSFVVWYMANRYEKQTAFYQDEINEGGQKYFDEILKNSNLKKEINWWIDYAIAKDAVILDLKPIISRQSKSFNKMASHISKLKRQIKKMES